MTEKKRQMYSLTSQGLVANTSPVCMNPAAHDPVLCWMGRESQQGGCQVLEGMSGGLRMAGSKWVPGKRIRNGACLKSQKYFPLKA